MRGNKGFTLIELIVVIGILSILAAGLLMILNPFNQFQKATDARRKSDLAQIQRALEVYYQDHGQYPSNTSAYQMSDPTLGTINWGQKWCTNSSCSGFYMNVVPQDPAYPASTYVYYSPDGQHYYLYANLSRGSLDPQACNGGNACTSLSQSGFPPATACGGSGCNFGVTSPNTSP